MAAEFAKGSRTLHKTLAMCVLVSICGCGVLPGKSALPSMRDYSLNAGFAPGPVGSQAGSQAADSQSCLAAQVMLPRSAAGFNTSRMAYTKNKDRLSYYSYNQWVDTPAKMLQPLLVEALQQSGRFGTVVKSPSPVRTRYRLISDELAVIQQIEGNDNVVRIGLRMQLLDVKEGSLVIDEPIIIERKTEANPQAGVVAANTIARDLLAMIADKVRAAVDAEAICAQ